MPISGASSYVSTCEAFLAHWAEANTALAGLPVPDALTLAGALLGQSVPVTRAKLAELAAALLEQRGRVTERLVDLDFARSDLAEVKGRLVRRAGEMIGVVRANAGGTMFERSLPLQPEAGDGLMMMLAAAVRVQAIWAGLDAGGVLGLAVPVVLPEGFDRAAFEAEVGALQAGYLAVTALESAVKLEQEARNDLQNRIYPLLKGYRQMVPTKFSAGTALVNSLPALTPAPGSTPDAVALTAVLDGPTQQARLAWGASAHAELDHYEVRAVPGGSYATDDEVAVATVPKEGPRELLTDRFLTEPGRTASFKVYVVLTTDNEAGSNAQAVSRPG